MRSTPADPAQRPSQSSWLAGIAIAAVPVLTAAPASALSFSFTYINNGEQLLSGLITGLADNTDSQTGPPVRVTVTSGPVQTLGTYTFRNTFTETIPGFREADSGFSTSNGDLILKQLLSGFGSGSEFIWTGFLPSPTPGERPLGFLRFARPTANEVLAPIPFGVVTGIWSPVLPTRARPLPDNPIGGPLPEGLIDGLVRFEAVADPPPAEVPGPLPLLGAAAAFRYNRKLRHRIQLQKRGQKGSYLSHHKQGGKGL